MFNIGFSELVVLGVLALIFIGPKQLPEVARTLGRFINELKRAGDEALHSFKDTHTKTNDFIRKTEDEIASISQSEQKPVEKKSEVAAVASEEKTAIQEKEEGSANGKS